MKISKPLLFVVISVCLTSLLNARITNQDANGLCEAYLLKKIAREKMKGARLVKLQAKEPLPVGVGQSAENSPLIKLNAFKTSDKSLSDNFKKWIESENLENPAAFELRRRNKKP